MSYEKALRTALDAALEAGELLRRELHRFGGPRGHSAHADADEEAEWLIRKRLLSVFPDYGYRGEETGSVASSDSRLWLVDPNDGTSAYLRGARGSAVSIALLNAGIPVLGVVYAFAAPDDRGDLIHWAEGFELTRNGEPSAGTWNPSDRNHVTILVSMHREALMETVMDVLMPFRYRANPSIAYRLALAACGDAEAAVSWHSPGDWDYAAGHALLRGAGGIFVNEEGREVEYAPDGSSKVRLCFGGHPGIVRDLRLRDWKRIYSAASRQSQGSPSTLFLLSRPVRGKAVASADLLSRAQGCMLGQFAGDALGQQVEFLDTAGVRSRFPRGVTRMEDGGTHNTIAGQPTDDSEMALLLARSIIREGKYVPEKAAGAYHYWFTKTRPFDYGRTIASALSCVTEEDVKTGRAAEVMRVNASLSSKANGSLMRISPLAIYGYRLLPQELWDLAAADSTLTHPHPVCVHSCALFSLAIADAIESGRGLQDVYGRTLRSAREFHAEPEVIQALEDASHSRPDYATHEGLVTVALQNAFYQLIHANTFEEGVIDTVMQGHDADTNAAIAGALLGAVHGYGSVPFQWRQMVLSCRPDPVTQASNPRPFLLWPVDALNLAELLLIAGWGR